MVKISCLFKNEPSFLPFYHITGSSPETIENVFSAIAKFLDFSGNKGKMLA